MTKVLSTLVSSITTLCRPLKLLLFGTVLSIVVACGGNSAPATPIDISNFEHPYTVYGDQPPPEWWEPLWPEASYVIRDRTQFRAAWDAREFDQWRPHPLPDVDFSKYMLVGISKGGARGCVGARITRVHQVGEELVVDSQLFNFAAANNNLCLFETVASIDFVLIPQNDLSVRFTQTLPVAK